MNLFNPSRCNDLWRLLALTACLLSSAISALPDDRDQLIEIESETAEFRELEGVTVYAGDVKVQQGSVLLKAEKVTLFAENGKVSRVLAEGGAYYEQLPEIDGEKVIAKGDAIEYQLKGDVIQLLNNASLTQEGATLNGNLITYDIRKHLLKANGQESAPSEERTSQGRIRVVLPPLNNDS